MENLLLVEGPDDVHVVKQLLKALELIEFQGQTKKVDKVQFQNRILNIQATAEDGNVIENFSVEVELSSKRYETIGLILDFDAPNESQANDRDISVRETIKRLQKHNRRWHLDDGFDVLSEEGFIAEPVNGDTPRIGVWLMPNNKDRGMLETFLQELIPEEQSKLLTHAKDSTRVAKDELKAPFKDVHHDKAVIHAFLAWMDEPGKPFGISFQNRNFDSKAKLACRFVDWMKKLFR